LTDEAVTSKNRATSASEYGRRVVDNAHLLPELREDAEAATHDIVKLFQNLRPPFGEGDV